MDDLQGRINCLGHVEWQNNLRFMMIGALASIENGHPVASSIPFNILSKLELEGNNLTPRTCHLEG